MSLNNFDNNHTSQKTGPVTKFFVKNHLASSEKSAQTVMTIVATIAFLLSIYFFFQVFSSPTPPPAPENLFDENLN